MSAISDDNTEAKSDGAGEEEAEKVDFVSAESLFRSAYSVLADVAQPSTDGQGHSNYKSLAGDILVLWATGWGFVAWRTGAGSFFITELVKAIKDYPDTHMIELMEDVITAVKNNFKAGPADGRHPGQCPQFLSSLERKLYLHEG